MYGENVKIGMFGAWVWCTPDTPYEEKQRMAIEQLQAQLDAAKATVSPNKATQVR